MLNTPYDLAIQLRDRRLELGMTQAQLATKAGVSRKWVGAAEHGTQRLALGLVFDLIAALGLVFELAPLPKIEGR